MTNEEAIKKIKSLCHDCDEFPHCVNTDPDCFKALEMAIKVLSAEPCEDCISRTEAIKAIRNYNVTIEVGRAIGKSQLADIVDSINKVQEKMISELPSVKPKTDVLDKIRAEIEEQVLESLSDGGDDWFVAEKVNECLEIIDKYTAESEDKK